MGKLIIDGNSVYEVDEECMKKKHPSGIPPYAQNCVIMEKEEQTPKDQQEGKHPAGSR